MKAVILSTPTQRTGIPIFEEEGEIGNQNSIISEHLCNRITEQFRRHEPDPELNNKKKQIKSMKNDRQKKILQIIRNEMSSEERKQKNDLNLETGTPSWLTTLLIRGKGYILNKKGFSDISDVVEH